MGLTLEGRRCLRQTKDMSSRSDLWDAGVVGGTLGVVSKEAALLLQGSSVIWGTCYCLPGALQGGLAKPSPGTVPQAPSKDWTRLLAREGHRAGRPTTAM